MRPAAVLLCLSTLACRVGKADIDGEGGSDVLPDAEAPDPALGLSADALEFGPVAVAGFSEGPWTVTLDVEVRNDGEGDLRLLEVSTEAGPFAVGPIDADRVAPGDWLSVPVTFAPEEMGLQSGLLVLYTNDPAQPEVAVSLSGTGLAPRLDMDAPLDVGDVELGCSAAATWTLHNTGNASLTISDLSVAAGDGSLEIDGSSLDRLPLTLAPGVSRPVPVRWTPGDEGTLASELTVSSNDPVSPTRSVPVTGAATAGWTTDRFTDVGTADADVVIAVDRSCSMNDDIQDLTANLSRLPGRLSTAGVDVQFAATVDDDGCINGPELFIDGSFSQSEAEETLESMIWMGSTYGANSERPLQLLDAALDRAVPGACNDGLVREDAALHLIAFSDEPDQSAGSFSHYVSAYRALKDDPDQVTVHAIGGDYPMGCGAAQAFSGAYEATVETGGHFWSICEPDWGTILTDLTDAMSAAGGVFRLSSEPLPSTLEVAVDGERQESGWSWSAGTQRITFTDQAALAGAEEVTVTYAARPASCD